MKLDPELQRGVLIRRYKRFLADVELADGSVVIAHCANPGSMMGVMEPGSAVWLSPNRNPKAKLDWRWEMIEVDGALVGINTTHANRIVAEALDAGAIPELAEFGTVRREVKYGAGSRIDFLLENPGRCYLEVKNVTLKRDGRAQFPDAVTARGTKHLRELAGMVGDGHRAVMLYLAQRADCEAFSVAADIDPEYAQNLRDAVNAGVEVLGYRCTLSRREIRIQRPLELNI